MEEILFSSIITFLWIYCKALITVWLPIFYGYCSLPTYMYLPMPCTICYSISIFQPVKVMPNMMTYEEKIFFEFSLPHFSRRSWYYNFFYLEILWPQAFFMLRINTKSPEFFTLEKSSLISVDWFWR